MRSSTSLPLSFLIAMACSSSPSYDADWSPGLAGKSDGLSELAREMVMGETMSGEIGSNNIDIFSIELGRGDEITATMDVTSGDLSPHFLLLGGLASTIHSESYNVTDDQLTKTYEIEHGGTLSFAVAAYQNQGSGEYDFVVECTGGTCAGEFSTDMMDLEQADDCLSKAQTCSFDRMMDFGGYVGSFRARQIFEGCLAEFQTDDSVSCSYACSADLHEGLHNMCEGTIANIPFWADQSQDCIDEVESCMADCTSLSDWATYLEEDELFDRPFAMCWDYGFNGTCPSYARSLTTCGGDIAPDSQEACYERCESIDGAWTDDLDTICYDECG